MRFSTLSEWLVWLEACHPRAIDLGLDRVAAVAGRLQLNLSPAKVISVAGTNGKGSCVAAIEALCLAAGLRVGCYTSPHFLRYNERIRIQGEPVSDAAILAAFERVDAVLRPDSLTYFEFGTLAALGIFQSAGLDVIVLEVGLGGRLDAVNLVDPDIAVVTSVGLDHTDWLGDNRESIGFEKAGIFRRGKPAICVETDPPDSLLAHATEIGADLQRIGIEFDLVDDTGEINWWCGDSEGGGRVNVGLGALALTLPPPSVAAALRVAEILGIDPALWPKLADVHLPGRFQLLRVRNRQLILDVAHNPQASELLAQRLNKSPVDGRRIALFGVMADKDIAGIVEPLVACFQRWSVASIAGVQRAASSDRIAAVVRSLGGADINEFNTVEAALDHELALMQAGDQLVVFGSFFTVAAVMQNAGL